MVQADQCLKHLDESFSLMALEVRSIVQVSGVAAYFWVDSATSVRGGNLGLLAWARPLEVGAAPVPQELW